MPVHQHLRQRRAERLARLPLDVVDAIDKGGEGTELGDPLGGGLLPDPRYAREVVTRVAAQRGEVRVLLGVEAVLLANGIRGHPGKVRDPLARIEHGHVITDELERVSVPRQDPDVVGFRRGPLRQRGDDVVRLESVHLQDGDPERSQDLLDQADLAFELLRRLRAVRLVLRVLLGAEGPAGDVEGDGDAIGLLVPKHVDEHGREPVHGIRGLARGRREVVHRKGVERSIGQRVPVDEQDCCHAWILGVS